jgi:hypothetical protein
LFLFKLRERERIASLRIDELETRISEMPHEQRDLNGAGDANMDREAALIERLQEREKQLALETAMKKSVSDGIQ